MPVTEAAQRECGNFFGAVLGKKCQDDFLSYISRSLATVSFGLKRGPGAAAPLGKEKWFWFFAFTPERAGALKNKTRTTGIFQGASPPAPIVADKELLSWDSP